MLKSDQSHTCTCAEVLIGIVCSSAMALCYEVPFACCHVGWPAVKLSRMEFTLNVDHSRGGLNSCMSRVLQDSAGCRHPS